jgi:hypothetical protein
MAYQTFRAHDVLPNILEEIVYPGDLVFQGMPFAEVDLDIFKIDA